MKVIVVSFIVLSKKRMIVPSLIHIYIEYSLNLHRIKATSLPPSFLYMVVLEIKEGIDDEVVLKDV